VSVYLPPQSACCTNASIFAPITIKCHLQRQNYQCRDLGCNVGDCVTFRGLKTPRKEKQVVRVTSGTKSFGLALINKTGKKINSRDNYVLEHCFLSDRYLSSALRSLELQYLVGALGEKISKQIPYRVIARLGNNTLSLTVSHERLCHLPIVTVGQSDRCKQGTLL
jgi:hypothetical protein